MKKLILSMVFVLAFVAVTPMSAKNSIKTNKFVIVGQDCQDCNDYASNAADQEVGLLLNFLTGGQAYLDSYNFWYGYCEGASAGGSTVLDPVFVKK